MTKNEKQSNDKNKILVMFTVVLCLTLLLPLVELQNVSAQTPPQDDWTPPVNLSNSGSASDPIILVDAENVTHVVWQDEFAGYLYTRSEEDGVWSEPAGVTFPFTDFRPRLLMGPDNLIYAFWIDSGASLFSSRVSSKNFGFSNSWEPRRPLTQNTLAYEVMVDVNQVMHLAYITNTDTQLQPAGVYYRQIVPGGGWSLDKRIYTSKYFRALVTDQARLSVAVAGTTETSANDGVTGGKVVFVAWDEPALRKVLLSRSSDVGETWAEALEVDPPTVVSEEVAPYDLDVTTWKDQILLVWKRLLSETSCSILYQISTNGEDWGAPAGFFSEEPGCPTNSGFLAHQEDLLIWQATINDEVFLAAWDGSRWSTPQAQAVLSGFKDPLSARTLSMGCHNLFYHAEQNMLYTVGCDQNGIQDIWLTRKTLDDLQAWFPLPSVWSVPMEIAQSPFGIYELNIVADGEGGFHALWAQPLTQNASSILHYSGWDGEDWSEPSAILRPPGGNPNQMTAGITQAGNLMVVWRGNEACQIYFSRTPNNKDFSGVEWMETVSLPTPPGTCRAPTLAAGDQETVFVAYAAAINEGRGVYLNQSLDGGRTWSPPVKVFDAQAAQWEMVDNPVIARSDGRLHILWRHGSLLNPGTAQGLGYAFSDDNGLTWSAADTSIEEHIGWAGLVASNGTLFRVWQQVGGEYSAIVTQTSKDDGQNWTEPVSVATFGDNVDSPRLMAKSPDGVHLVQINRDHLGNTVLKRWNWFNQSWAAGEDLELGSSTNRSVLSLSGVLSPQNQIALLFSTNTIDIEGQSLEAVISTAGANNLSSELLPTAQAPLGPTAEVAISKAVTPAVSNLAEPTSTGETKTIASQSTQEPLTQVTSTLTPVAALAGEGTTPEPASNNSWYGLILGIALAALIVLGVFGIRVAQSRI